MPEFSSENQTKLKEILTRYPTKQAAVLPTLWMAQRQFGTLSNEVLKLVAKSLDLSPIHVYEVATFYTMFNLKPVGRHHIQLCRTLSCALCGAEDVLKYIKEKLQINEGETTPDGRFTLTTVECLASCGTAPAMMVNEAYYENLTPQKIDEILDGMD